MNELQQLLERWEELERGRCEYDEHANHTRHHDGGTGYRVKISNQNDSMYLIGYKFEDAHILQGAVQQAIEARNWGWAIYCDIEGLYMGKVSYPDQDLESRMKYEESHEAPGIALLAAYLQALEATVEVE